MGVIFVIIGLALSIGLHEFGHLIPAKLFGVRVPNWAIGFGPKLFSKQIGETEYSFRLIPLGGFITMIGMYPPDRKGKDATRRFGKTIAAARAAHSEHMVEGDEGKRTLYSLSAWKRIVIMFGGPFTNLVLGLVLLTTAFAGAGTIAQTTKVDSVVKCLDAMTRAACNANSEPTPAVTAGLKAGDEILAIAGNKITDYASLQTALRASGESVALLVQRGSHQLTLDLPAVSIDMPFVDSNGKQSTRSTRIIGVNFEVKKSELPLGAAFTKSTDLVGMTFASIATFPQQVYSAVQRTFLGESRDPNGAVSIVGVAQASASMDSWLGWIYLVGSLNIALFVFNMIPLPPLDGGHIAGGIYEYLKRGAFRLVGKKDPGPIDTALIAPVAQFMFIVLFLAGILTIYADLVNPISF